MSRPSYVKDADELGVTAEFLRQRYYYDPETGEFSWINRPRGPRKPVGCVYPRGYVLVSINLRRYLAHRLAWLYMTGDWPKDVIDHIDGNPSNNRFANLRDVSSTVNQQNRRSGRLGSKTGLLGVTGTGPKKTKYRAIITVDGEQRNLGAFSTAEEAYAAYVAAKRQLHPGCTL